MDPFCAVEKLATNSGNASPRDWYEKNGDDPWNGIGEVRAELARRPDTHKKRSIGDSAMDDKRSEKNGL